MIEIDKESARNLQKQFDALKKESNRSSFSALMKVAFKVKTEAQLRLTGRGHIITSRLKNSMFIKSKKMDDVLKRGNSLTYSDNKGQSFDSDFSTETLDENEFAIGTNVEYGESVEIRDSYLYWALKNVNVMQSVSKDMQEDLKTGKFAR